MRLYCAHYIIFKLNNKRELQNLAINYSADIDYKDFVKIYRNYTKEPYNILTIDSRQPADKRFENKDESWRKKHDFRNLKDFSYQVDEVNKADVREKEVEHETDKKLPPRIKVSNSRFNEIKDVTTKANESKLMTRLEGRNITLKCGKVTRRYDQWKD